MLSLVLPELSDVEKILMKAIKNLSSNKNTVIYITAYDWIVNGIMNAT